MSGKKRKKRSIRLTVDFYNVCISYIICCLLVYIRTILTHFFTPGERSSGNICHTIRVRTGQVFR